MKITDKTDKKSKKRLSKPTDATVSDMPNDATVANMPSDATVADMENCTESKAESAVGAEIAIGAESAVGAVDTESEVVAVGATGEASADCEEFSFAAESFNAEDFSAETVDVCDTTADGGDGNYGDFPFPVAEEAADDAADSEIVAEEVADDAADSEIVAEEAADDAADSEVVAEEVADDAADSEVVAEEAADDAADSEVVAEEAADDAADSEVVAEEAADDAADSEVVAEEVADAEADGDTEAMDVTDFGEPAEGTEEVAEDTREADAEIEDATDEEFPTPTDGAVGEKTENAISAQQKRKLREDGSRKIDGIFDFIELFVFTLAIVLLLTSFVVRHSVVEGDSMLGTLHSGETLIISDLFYEPRVGDIVVVDDHSTALKKPIIKRVIALGGDTVRVTKVGIVVNGELLSEPYVYTDEMEYHYSVYPSEAYLDNETLTVEVGVYYEFVVPEGELFVLGDHRNKSTDSRDIGTVDADAVVGRVLFRILPFDVFGKVE